MTFAELLDQVLALLRRQGLATYRVVQRQFDLDDGSLADVQDALLNAHPDLVADDGRGLAWTGMVGLMPTAVPPEVSLLPAASEAGVAGADLGRARGLRRGPAPRGGGAPPRHAGRPRANTNRYPRLPRTLYFAKGVLEDAIRVLEQGLALCRASGERSWLRWILAGLGSASALQGRLAEGHALLEEGISESLRAGALFGQAYRGRMAQ
jgi:hypothetical protein